MSTASSRESRAELVLQNGRVVDIVYTTVAGRRPLEGGVLRDFKALVEHYPQDIVQKWIDCFVLHRPVQPQMITRRIK